MKREPIQIKNDPIIKLEGLISRIIISPSPSNSDVKQALIEIADCFKYLKNEIELIKNRKE